MSADEIVIISSVLGGIFIVFLYLRFGLLKFTERIVKKVCLAWLSVLLVVVGFYMAVIFLINWASSLEDPGGSEFWVVAIIFGSALLMIIVLAIGLGVSHLERRFRINHKCLDI